MAFPLDAPVVVADLDIAPTVPDAAVLVGVGRPDHRNAAAADVVVDDPDEVVHAIGRNPIAAVALALHLRASEALPVAHALVSESAVYSLLQAGPEHQAWLAAQPTRPAHAGGEPLRLERDDDHLLITLDRPEVRNAFSAAMRDALYDALELAALDPSITAVELRGDGPSFCSGGDLAEFGTLPDPATAHLVRVARSAGRALHRVGDRVTVYLQGACVGAGVELPAFAGRVAAAPDTTLRLPEVGMGLIPGAGGSVSIPRRIGRQRAAWLALTGNAIDAPTALDWGLIDEISGGES